MHDLLTTAYITVLVVIALWALTFLFDLIRAPSLLHKQQRAMILEQTNSIHNLREKTSEAVSLSQEQVVREKVMNNLKACSLDGLRLIRYVYDSGGTLHREELSSAFGIAAIENAEKTMLLEKQTSWMINEGRQTYVYSIRKEYKAILGDMLSDEQNP